MDVTREFRTRYAAYLQSERWRETRNRALRRAYYRCERCHGKRSLEVHHLSYERLGAELPSDLEVVCHQCHADEHLAQMEQMPSQALYLKLAREVVRENPHDTMVGLSEMTKRKCATLGIRYNSEVIWRALELVVGKSIVEPTAADTSVRPTTPGQPISHEEAVALIRRLQLEPVMRAVCKPTSQMQPVSQRKADHVRALKLVMHSITDSIATCEALEAETER